MPARVADRRRARASAAASSAKPTTTSGRSRASKSSRSSANAVEIPDEGESTSLREQVCRIFGDAQRTTATQRKLVVQLRKIQEACCYEPVKAKKHQTGEEFGEEQFNAEITRCVLRILPVKKSEPVGDRIVKFLGLYLKHATDKDNKIAAEADPDATTLPETPSSRLTTHILSALIPLLTAKDRVVRFRAAQITSHLLNNLESIDDELFPVVRLGLLKRLHDKEAQVRVQAVLGLGRLTEENDDSESADSDEDEPKGLMERLLHILQHDPAAEVRRSLLLNLPLVVTTLPYLLERARDLDPATRRALYSRLLPALGDFRHLSLTHREKLLRWGLRDRDENVRKAAARLFRERWIEDCAGAPGATQDSNGSVAQPSKPSYNALLELLERIDVNTSGVEGGIAHEAMKEFWEGRPDYRDFISFDDPFWDNLTPESAFIARSFNDYCRTSGDSRLQSVVEDKMPEVTKYGYLIQRQIKKLIEGVQKVAEDEENFEAEEEAVQQEFCTEQLLHIALTLDYTDEIGRRKMFSTMREALAIPDLPEECTKLVVEILRTVCGDNIAGEREFCDIVLEAVADVHDTILDEDELDKDDDNESFHSARSDVDAEKEESVREKLKKRNPDMTDEELDAAQEERVVQEIMVNMKCLHIAQCMLQNVQCELESNTALVVMLNNLIVPAVRSQEAPIRERGFICLGLCCLLSKNIAQQNLNLFLHCFAKGHEALQIIALQIITDMLTTHPSLLAPPPVDPDASEVNPINPMLKPIHKMFLKALKSQDSGVASTGAVAASKLMLLNTLQDPDLLKAMTIAYFNPESQQNPGLRQALAYFLPVYCHSRKENAERMASIAVSIVHTLWSLQDEMEEDDDVEMVGINVVGSQIVDWTDPRKLVGAEEMGGKLVSGESKIEGLGDAHVLLAQDLLEKILSPAVTRNEKKNYISMLGKLHIHPSSSPDKIEALTELVEEALDSKPAATEAAFYHNILKLSSTLAKLTAPAEKADAGGAVAIDTDEAGREQGKDDDQTTVDGRNDEGNDEAASAVDASEADAAPSVAGDADEMSVVEEEEEDEDTVVQHREPQPQESEERPMAALSLEEQIQMQLQDETMRDVDAEGTVMPMGDEMDIDEDEEVEEEEEEDEEEEEETIVAREPTPTPPPPPQSTRKGRPKKKPEPAPESETEEASEEEEDETPRPQRKRRGRPKKAVDPAPESEPDETAVDETPQPPAKRRGRPKKLSGSAAPAAPPPEPPIKQEDVSIEMDVEEVAPKQQQQQQQPKKRGRPPGSGGKKKADDEGKAKKTPAKRGSGGAGAASAEPEAGESGSRRGRGRPRKAAAAAAEKARDVVDELLSSDEE